jgi:ribosome biogenesis GTPase
VLAISALMPGAATALQPYLRPGQTGALVGSSGAGKSTIVNQLVATACQPTQATRSTDGRGRHTTSNRELFLLPTGGLILDNPGMRELQLWPEQASLYSAFPEIEEIARRCAFRDCSHQGDQGCAIAEELANGRLDTERWRSYLKLRRELRHISLEADIHARQQEKRRIKKLCKDVKRLAERERGYR